MRTNRTGLFTILVALLLAPWIQHEDARSDATKPAPKITLTQFERLSFDLRKRRLDTDERKAIEKELAGGDKAAGLAYAKHVDQWLTKDALKGFVLAFLRFPPVAVVTPDAETFFHRLAKQGSGDATVYYLPHSTPCPADQATSVPAWWSKTPVKVCKASYVPEKIFDTVGYCSGEAEPLMRQPPRAGCGCGPMLMGCLPPQGDNAPLDKLVQTSVMDEWLETAARIVAEGKPLDELVTTSRTWQSGLAEFLYARREAIADHKKSAWNADVQKRIETRLKAIDVYAAPRWVTRKGPYTGSGLWWTSLAVGALKIPVRPAAHHLLERHLCMPFTSVNVDAVAVLKAVGKHESNLRTLSSLTAAPMRFQNGCKGCHSPMDGAAGFMGDIQGPLYGSYVTGSKSEGEFYVGGDKDRRGKGVGSAALAKFVVGAPEFESCSVRRAYEQVLQAPVPVAEQANFEKLTKQFKTNGHRWAPIVRALLVSDAYMFPAAPPPDATPPKDIPGPVAKLVGDVCSDCHDSKHAFDLSKVPPSSDVAAWKKIHSRVADYSMPPPSVDEDIAHRYPLDPTERRAFLGALGKMLGPNLETPQPPRRMPHPVWASIVRRVAEPSIGADKVTAILEPLIKKDGFFAKLPPRGLPPPYVLAVETASESVCREVARADKTYGITAGEWTPAIKSASVGKLLEAVYGRPATEPELQTEVALLDQFQGATKNWPDAWAAVCSTNLSGPRLFFSDYIGGGAK